MPTLYRYIVTGSDGSRVEVAAADEKAAIAIASNSRVGSYRAEQKERIVGDLAAIRLASLRLVTAETLDFAERLLADVVDENPTFDHARSIDWTLDGVNEAYELRHEQTDAVRDFIEALP